MSESRNPTDDQLHRFLFDDADIRGEIVTLADSYQQVLDNNPVPAPVQQLLGEFLAAAALLSYSLKFDGIITLQAQGSGPVQLLMAECDHHRGLRATVRLADEAGDIAGAGLQQLMGRGLLAITIDPDKGERYQGVVPLEQDSLAACLEDYFAQSEQLPTRLWLAAADGRAAGLLLQALPASKEADPERNAEQWQTVVALAATVTNDELLSLDHSSNLYRLFNELDVRLFDPSALQFACSCSESRSLAALTQLGRAEVYEILEIQGHISIDCQFCNQHYQFDEAQVRPLFEAADPTVH